MLAMDEISELLHDLADLIRGAGDGIYTPGGKLFTNVGSMSVAQGGGIGTIATASNGGGGMIAAATNGGVGHVAIATTGSENLTLRVSEILEEHAVRAKSGEVIQKEFTKFLAKVRDGFANKLGGAAITELIDTLTGKIG